MIDHKQIKPGDFLRIGYSSWFMSPNLISKGDGTYDVCLQNHDGNVFFVPLSIITEHKSFEWTNAGQGMAFEDPEGNVFYYVGKDFSCDKCVVVSDLKNITSHSLFSVFKSKLVRCPDMDIIEEKDS